MTGEERKQVRLEAFREVEEIIHKELESIIGDKPRIDDPKDAAAICAVNRIGSALNKLIHPSKRSSSPIGASAGGAMTDFDLSEEMSRLVSGPIPPVDPNDLESVWVMLEEIKKHMPDHAPNQTFGVDIDYYRRACGPGANVEAVWYRFSMYWVLQMMSKQGVFTLPELLTDGKPSDAVFKALATMRMSAMQPGDVFEEPPVDVEELTRLIRKEESAT